MIKNCGLASNKMCTVCEWKYQWVNIYYWCVKDDQHVQVWKYGWKLVVEYKFKVWPNV